MPAVGVSIFTEPDAYRADLREGAIDLVVTRGGDFTARLTRVALPNLHLLHSQETLPRIAWIAPARKCVCIAFPTQLDPAVTWNGTELEAGDIVFQGDGVRAHQRTSGASQWAYISLAPEYLTRYGKALTGVDLEPPRGSRVLRAPRIAAGQLRRLHAKACRLAETKPKVIAHRQVARALEHDLLHALVNCLTAGRARDKAVARRRHADIMNRFENLLASHVGRQLPTSRICASIHVSERTLRVCCAEFLGMGPGRYIRLRRLNLVRAALRRTDSVTTSVGELARRYGFSELGRFAIRYRAFFGERPSATLRRPRSSMGNAPIAEKLIV
jgi:AraC-like DNA-binding protein